MTSNLLKAPARLPLRRFAWIGVLTNLSVAKQLLLYFFGAFLILYLFLAAEYPLLLIFADHVEPSKACLAWYYWQGHALYQNFTTHERYSVIYGPNTFIAISWSEALLGPSVFSAKLPCALAGICSVVLLFFTFQKNCSTRQSIALTGLCALLFLFVMRMTYGVYTDPFLLLTVSLAVFFFSRRYRMSPFLIGLCLGLAENLKVHGLVYFMPLYCWALFDKQWRISDFAVSLLASLVVFSLPFILCKNVIITDYVAIFRMSANTFEWQEFEKSVLGGLVIAFPFVFVLLMKFILPGSIFFTGTSEVKKIITLAFFSLLLIIPASRSGAGSYHFIELVPSYALLLSQYRLNSLGRLSYKNIMLYLVFLAWIGIAGSSASIQTWQVFEYFISETDYTEKAYADDLQALVKEEPNWTILMGGSTDQCYFSTYFRYVLIFDGMPIGVDPVALMDFQRTGHGELQFDGLTQELKARYGRPVMWLFAKNQRPFAMHTYCFNGQYLLYPENFRKDFYREYRRYGSTRFYDAYVPR